MTTKVLRYYITFVVILFFFVLTIFGYGKAVNALAGFNSEIQNSINSENSGTLILTDTIGAVGCQSSANLPGAIASNSANCSDYPLSQSTNTATNINMANTGSLLPATATISSYNCGVQQLVDSSKNDTALANGYLNYMQTGPAKLAGSYSIGLNGSNGYGETLSYLASPGPQTFSIAAWFKTATDGSIIGFTNSQTNTGQSYWDRHLWIDDTGHLVFGLYPNGIYELKSPSTFNNNAWHFVVVTVNPTTATTGTVKMFVDGAKVAGFNNDETYFSGTNPAQVYGGWWHLGWSNASQGWTDSPTNPYFNGNLTQISVFNSILSLADVKNLYSQASDTSYINAVTGYGPYADWTLQDNPLTSIYAGTVGATGTYTFPDVSNNPGTNTGFGQGNFTQDPNGPLGNTATIFNGGSYIETSTNSASPGPQTFSIAAWFKTATDGSIIGFTNSQTNTGQSYWDRHLWIDDTGHLVFGLYPNGIYELKSPSTFNNNAWHFVVVTVSPSTTTQGSVSMYVDGNLVAGGPNSETYLNGATQPAQVYGGWWHLGWSNADQSWPDGPTNPYFSGSLGQIAIFGTSLTATQVSTIYSSANGGQYSSNVTGSIATSTSYWTLQSFLTSNTPCDDIGVTIGDLSTGTCVYPIMSSPCPLAASAGGLDLTENISPDLGSFAFTAYPFGTVPANIVNLHATVTWQVQTAYGGFSAMLMYNDGFVYI